LGGFLGYYLYQRHLSSDLKRILVAAMDPHCSVADVQQYLHAARPLVRTKRDWDVLAQTQKAFEMAVDAQQTSDEYLQYLQQTLDDGVTRQSAFWKLEQIEEQYRSEGLRVPADLKAQEAEALKEEKRESDEWKQRDNDADREQAEAGKLFNQVRADIGMPPLPQK
jgi:hypothetical protein